MISYEQFARESTPEPLPVQISYAVCPNHNFNLISVPRDAGTGEQVYFKCPLRSCGQPIAHYSVSKK
jgi:hypothetical protein